MSSLARRLSPYVIGALTSPLTRNVRRRLVEQRRRLSGDPQRVLYFHQIDDPYSQLAAQVLPELLARYEVELAPHLVGPPSDAASPTSRVVMPPTWRRATGSPSRPARRRPHPSASS